MRLYLLLFSFSLGCSEKSIEAASSGDSWTDDDGTSDGGTSDGGTSDGGTSDGGSSDDGSSDGGSSDGGSNMIEGNISLDGGLVMDPKLLGDPALAMSFSMEEAEDCEAAILVSNGIGQIRTLSNPDDSTSWDGRDDEGRAFDPGEATIKLTAVCDGAEQEVAQTEAYIVRLGPSLIDLMSPEGASGQVGLAYHKKSLIEVDISPVGERPEYKQEPQGVLGSGIDRDDGSARPAVALWTNAHIPPWADGEVTQHNVPTGYIAERAMAAMVELDDVAISEARHIAVSSWGPEPEKIPAIRLASNGALIEPGESLEVALGNAASTMGKHIQTVEWTFETEDKDGTWHPIPGMFETEHAYYVLAGEPALLDGSSFGASPAVPWIGVLEDTSEQFEGVPATTEDTLDTLRDYLFNHEYLIYDPGSGTYSDFDGPYMYWSSITAQVSSFLDRREGLSLYCHSMSCMLSALAGNHGVRAEQIVLGVNFTTNLTRAAGTDSWRAWSFNSHSVVTPDDGETIWDASIALDGDDEPDDDGEIDEVMPKGMTGDEYMWRLTYDDIGIINQGLCYIE